MNNATVDSRLDAARALASPCRLCPRRCGVDRLRGEIGFCGADGSARLFLEYVHWAEDEDISPAQTLHFLGCNLSCSFCQTRSDANRLSSAALDAGLFRSVVDRGRRAGAASVDVLGGEPTVNLFSLFEVFAEAGDVPPLVWNTNLYMTGEVRALLDGVADVWLADLKFGSKTCAAALSGAADAAEVAWERALEVFASSPDALIARHLVVPGHFECCTRPILEKIARLLPGVRASLRTGYMPPRDMPKDAAENRFLPAHEAGLATALARDLGLRLTRVADPDAGAETPSGGGATDFELAITPGGEVYARHVTGEAADLLRAAGFATNE